MPNWKKVVVSGSDAVLNSVTASFTGSLTGALIGTASWATNATNAISASFASTASFVNPLNQNVTISGSLFVSSSIVGSGSTYNTTIDLQSATISTNGTASIAYGVKYLFDNKNVRSIVWDARQLLDNSQSLSVNYNSRTLNSGSTTVLDWSSGTGSLIGISSTSSVSEATATVRNTNNANFFPTFVDSNNSTKAYELIYTAPTIAFNPATATLGVANISASSIITTNGFTGSLQGTASWAVSASQAITASVATSASYALSASYAPGGAAFPFTGSALITGSLGVTGSTSIRGTFNQGSASLASGLFSHVQGFESTASGNYSHAEGYNTTATALYSHAEGNSTQATGLGSHAEGVTTQATGAYSHAEGATTTAVGFASHTEGYNTRAIGDYSHAEGSFTVASGAYQHVQGQYNLSSSAESAFIIGNGTSTSARSNLVFASGSQFQITGSLIVSGTYGGIDTSLSNAALLASDGTATVVFGLNRQWLNEIGGNTTVDWGNKLLYDSTAAASIDWENRILYEASNAYEALNFSNSASVSSQLYYNNVISNVTQRYLADGPLFAGQVIQASVDAAVTIYDLVYLDTDGVWYLLKNLPTVSTKMLGICTDTAGYVLIEGDIGVSDDGSQGAHVVGADYGLPIYISNTNGVMTTTVPTSGVVRILGHVYYNSSTDVNWWTMKFRPSTDWYEI